MDKHSFRIPVIKMMILIGAGLGLMLIGASRPSLTAALSSFAINSAIDAVDANPGDGSCATSGGACTLRAAIQESNALSGDDTIIVPAGVYTLTIAGRDEDAAATGDLDITADMRGKDQSLTDPAS